MFGVKMYSPALNKLNLIILIVSAIWMKLSVCKTNRYSQISYIDSAIRNFIKDEEQLWDKIHSPSNPQRSQNATLNEILQFFRLNFTEPYVANIDFVRTINYDLAQHSTNIDLTYAQAIRRLNESMITQEFCENVVRHTRQELDHIFDITKTAAFINYLRDNSDFCQTHGRIVSPGGESLSLQNVIMDFYTAVPEALLKGYKAVQMCHMFLAVKNPKSRNLNSTPDLRSHESVSYELRRWFQSNHQSLRDNVFSIARNFSGEIWSCDDFTKPMSYTEITNFVQGYIENEVNFNQEGSCTGTCSDYRWTRQHGCANSTMCHINYLDKNKTRCDGQIRSCRKIESDMMLCPNEDDTKTNRRYNYVEYSSGLTLGRKTFCPEQVKVKSWLRWFVSCDFCFCYCDYDGFDESKSDRYFSLREARSNIEENKVVTGIRLVKKYSMIHVIIAERQLDGNGQIRRSEHKHYDDAWKGDYDFVIRDTGVEEGKDYHKLTWRDRAIELDTIVGPKNHVLTGARFRVVNKRLRFEIQITEFNYETGYLMRGKSHWQGGNHNVIKEQIPIEEADVPILSPHKSKRHREENKYVEFTPTDIYKDMAQSTVPFIDTQKVEAIEPRPLRGAGIYYKSSPGYGGFIAPLIVLHDVDNDSF